MVPGQLEDSHCIKAMSVNLIKSLAHSAITAAIIHNHYFIREVCTLLIPSILQVSARYYDISSGADGKETSYTCSSSMIRCCLRGSPALVPMLGARSADMDSRNLHR